jgi:mRNA interferase MazF
MRRGEIWWADLRPPASRRPVVLLSRSEAYAVRELVAVAPVTTRARHIPTEVPLGPVEGLPKACVANLDTITTIPRRTLTQLIGPLPPEKLAAVERALVFALGLGSRPGRAIGPAPG